MMMRTGKGFTQKRKAVFWLIVLLSAVLFTACGNSGEKPMIGIMPQYYPNNTRYSIDTGFSEGILEAGGIPLMLPATTDEAILRQCLAQCDGIIFAGGCDIDPSCYEEERIPECNASSLLRDESEMLMMKLALEADIPILGICRGSQMINVVMGGTLYQDIPSQLNTSVVHKQAISGGKPTHSVSILPDTPLAQLLGKTELMVNSYHHQCIKDAAPGMQIMAKAQDGVIEAFCFPEKRFLWGVQWHPEMSLAYDEESGKIFEMFLHAVKEK